MSVYCHKCQKGFAWLHPCNHGYFCKSCSVICDICADEDCPSTFISCADCSHDICQACITKCPSCLDQICEECCPDLRTCKFCRISCCGTCIEGHRDRHRRVHLIYGAIALNLNSTILLALANAIDLAALSQTDDSDSDDSDDSGEIDSDDLDHLTYSILTSSGNNIEWED
jgi:hypothetical protein